jgi:3'(2'), 5'-bisphosphate nucleotidase
LKVLDDAGGVDSVRKEDRSPVTTADLASQAAATAELLANFTTDPVVGEEQSDPLRENDPLREKVLELVCSVDGSFDEKTLLETLDYGARNFDPKKRFWTIDPIDGTRGFLRRDQFAVALALVEDGEVVLGVLGCPNLESSIPGSPEKGVVFHAVRAAGTHMMPLSGGAAVKTRVDGIAEVARARFCESVEKAHASHETHRKIADALGIVAAPCRMDSQVKYAALARGDASIYLRLPRSRDYREKIWDHAAGSIVVEEAGGKVTDFRGNPLRFDLGRKLSNNIGILATNGRLHEKALRAIADAI